MSENKKKVALYIDGSNLYHKLHSMKFHELLSFDYSKFAKWLADDRELVSARYYIGAVEPQDGDQKSQELHKEQQKLFSKLGEHGYTIKTGYLLNIKGVFHEKGVDVKLATDLLVGAYENLYDNAILISSDTDLIPALQKVKHLGKTIDYIGFSRQPSSALAKVSTRYIMLKKQDLIPFVNAKK